MRDILDALLTEHAPFHSTLPFDQAFMALGILLGRSLPPGLPEHDAALETMRHIHEEWLRATSHGHRTAEAPCPACTYGWISLARMRDHVPLCPGHPAFARLAAAADALELQHGADAEVSALLGEAAGLLGSRAPHRRWPTHRGSLDVDLAFDHLDGKPDEPFTDKDATILSEVFAEWARIHFPEADTCPFCKEATPLEKRLAHLLACSAHPAARLAAELEVALGARLGAPAAEALLGAFTLRNTPRDELRELVQSCERYEAEWGYEEHGVFYSKYRIEDPWLARLERAEEALALAVPEAAPPPEIAPDVERLREEAERWRAALKALWTASRRIWSSMGDGDRGKSLIPERIVPPWKRAIEEAKAVVGQRS
jgi:thiol-disulfide isomerase/thioredoxin